MSEDGARVWQVAEGVTLLDTGEIQVDATGPLTPVNAHRLALDITRAVHLSRDMIHRELKSIVADSNPLLPLAEPAVMPWEEATWD